MGKGQWEIFVNSIFFVLGFSIIFSLVGVLLQSVLSNYAYTVQNYLSYVGGAVIILFGFYLIGLIKIGFLEREHKFNVKKRFKYSYATSFVFGAAFAIGWTPCVGAVLGSILTIAITNPGSAFYFLFAYSIGLGLPFLIVGLFTSQASGLIERIVPKLKYLNYIFGIILIILGIFVFTQQLSRIANVPFLTNLLVSVNSGAGFGSKIGIGIAFLAGLFSFLSPCVLPIIPGFLSYLATTAVTTAEGKSEG
ncbi:sulfite exporter TauE/SafE family protein [Candidatus Woesearchaeota archaeon]|nr:sulfite exporter TauE/SafE family protein [Candidatus Woesearchaeota archaeon]